MPEIAHSDITSGTTITTTTETVVASFVLPNVPNQGSVPGLAGGLKALLTGTINITEGTSTTALVVRVRQGFNAVGATSPSGNVVGNADTHTLAAASSPANIPFTKFDPASTGAYSLTVQQTGAGANGTVNSAELIAITGSL